MAEIRSSRDSTPKPLGDWRCNVCGNSTLTEITAYRRLRRVSSDVRSWTAGGRVHVCQHCGAVQKIADAEFQQEVDKIYGAYAVYHQSNGAEQSVFSQGSGAATSRSRRMLEELQARVTLPRTGRMLDIGCGNGVMLLAFHEAQPQWKLAGAELNDLHRAAVESIPNCEKLYTCSLREVPGQFDLITMVHSLEHMVDPVECLRDTQLKLAPGALLMIEVPNLLTNPFDITIADHTSHFTESSLRMLLKQAGYEVLHFSDSWISKELTAIVRPCDVAAAPVPSRPEQVELAMRTVDRNLRWLAATVDAATQLSRRGPLGLFGTSIAATWLSSELGDSAAFFVDEDPNRPGKDFLGRPVLSPAQVPAGSRVFIGLPPNIAGTIRDRLRRPGVEYIAPPALE